MIGAIVDDGHGGAGHDGSGCVEDGSRDSTQIALGGGEGCENRGKCEDLKQLHGIAVYRFMGAGDGCGRIFVTDGRWAPVLLAVWGEARVGVELAVEGKAGAAYSAQV